MSMHFHFVMTLIFLFVIAGCGGGSSSSSGPGPDSGPEFVVRPLNDTGIVLCGNYAYDGGSGDHKNDLDCAVAGATQITSGADGDGDPVPAGQDAVFGRDAQAAAGALIKTGAGDAGFDFTKLDANGDELAAAATEWDCVRDNVTGLIWEVKADDGGLRDQSHTYTWFNSNGSTNGGDAGTPDGGSCNGGSGCDIEKFVDDVNKVGLCGIDDWRMPQARELDSIIHRDRIDPTIDEGYFPNAANHNYWSITPEAGAIGRAYYVRFDVGFISRGNKADSYRARLVSGSLPGSGLHTVNCDFNEGSAIVATTPTDDFTDHDDGTVTHNTTGLMWMQCSLGQSGLGCVTGTPTNYNWLQAHKVLEDANNGAGTLGFTDWRLPNIKELGSIVERRCSSLRINADVFPKTPGALYWSSSPYAGLGGRAWWLGSATGVVDVASMDFGTGKVRLVRDAD